MHVKPVRYQNRRCLHFITLVTIAACRCSIRGQRKRLRANTGASPHLVRLLPLLSIFSVRDDYRMNDPARKLMLLTPTQRRKTRRRMMKYICLGYIEPGKFEGMTEDERHRTFDECFEYNDHLRANGHLVAEVALQPPETALTLYWKNGKVATTDGPYAETKEQLGGIQILEARDLNHAVQLVSQLPGFKFGLGPVEIRPVMDLSEIIKESEQRRRRKETSR
jgi:hypothetical protein